MLNKYIIKMQTAALDAIRKIDELVHDEKGEVNIIAIIIILAIAIALAIIFRQQIKALFDKIWGSIQSNSDDALTKY